MKRVLLILILLLVAGVGFWGCGEEKTQTTQQENSGTLFTGYVPGKKVEKNGNETGENEEPAEEKGIFFTAGDREIEVPPENINIIEQQAFVFIGGDVDVDNVRYTINFTFIKAVSYPHTYNLVTGRPSSQDDAVFFYQEAVSGGTVKTIQKVKDGLLVIKSYNAQELTGSFWARIGLDNGEDLYITNGKINLER